METLSVEITVKRGDQPIHQVVQAIEFPSQLRLTFGTSMLGDLLIMDGFEFVPISREQPTAPPLPDAPRPTA